MSAAGSSQPIDDMTVMFQALEDIYPGDELTVDYHVSEMVHCWL